MTHVSGDGTCDEKGSSDAIGHLQIYFRCVTVQKKFMRHMSSRLTSKFTDRRILAFGLLFLMIVEVTGSAFLCREHHAGADRSISSAELLHHHSDPSVGYCLLNHDREERSSTGAEPAPDIVLSIETMALDVVNRSADKARPILSATDPYLSPPPNSPFQPPKIA